MRLYDTHCHFERADPTEIAAILLRAKAAGVEKLMAVGGSPALNESAALAVEVANEALVAPKVCCAVGFDREQVGKNTIVQPSTFNLQPAPGEARILVRLRVVDGQEGGAGLCEPCGHPQQAGV